MGRHCFVPKCSGAKKERVTVFKAPSDPERLAVWDAAIGRKDRKLTPNDGVCSRHFPEDMIIRKRYFAELGGKTLLDVPKRSVLASDAVPCIFQLPANSGQSKRKRQATANPPPERSKETGPVEAVITSLGCLEMLAIKEELKELSEESPEKIVINQEEMTPAYQEMLALREEPREPTDKCAEMAVINQGEMTPGYQAVLVIKGEPRELPSECPEMTVIKQQEITPGCQATLAISEELNEPVDECLEVAVIKQEIIPLGSTGQEPEQSCLGISSESLVVNGEEKELSGPAEQQLCLGIPSVHNELNQLKCLNSACEQASQATFLEPSAGVHTGAVERNSNSVWLDPSLVSLPDAAWNYHRVSRNGLHSVCYIKVSLTPSGSPLSSKVLMVQQVRGGTFSLNTLVLDRKVSISCLPTHCQLHCPNDWSVVNTALRKFHELKLCAGGPSSEKYANVRLECGYKDVTGVWRHNRCPFLLEGKTRCSDCGKLSNTLRVHKARKEKRQNPKRVRICLSPAEKEQVDLLRRQRIACERSKVRLVKAQRKLMSKLLLCQNELNAIKSSLPGKTQPEVKLSAARDILISGHASQA